jgi:hypothetical protein
MHPVTTDPDDQRSNYEKAIGCSNLPNGVMTISYDARKNREAHSEKWYKKNT